MLFLSRSLSFFLFFPLLWYNGSVIIAVITSRRKLDSMTLACAGPRSRLRYLPLVMCELVRFERQKNERVVAFW